MFRLREIETKLNELDDLLSIGLENIRILRFYPEYSADEATYKELEEKIKELDKRLRRAIEEREQVALRLT